jgi:hypothetical protein
MIISIKLLPARCGWQKGGDREEGQIEKFYVTITTALWTSEAFCPAGTLWGCSILLKGGMAWIGPGSLSRRQVDYVVLNSINVVRKNGNPLAAGFR